MHLTKGFHLVVYVPLNADRDVPFESKAWIAESWQTAIKTIERFIWSDDFDLDSDCRFEIFDDVLESMTDQKLIEGLIMDRLEHEADYGEIALDGYDKGMENFPDEPPCALPAPTPVPAPAPPKVVTFSEIKIEDTRK